MPPPALPPPPGGSAPPDQPPHGASAPQPHPPASAPVAVQKQKKHVQNKAQTESVLRDKMILRKLFLRYQESQEKDAMEAQDRDAHPGYELPFGDRHDVMLDPYVFRRVCRELQFKPSVDLFANRLHHQVPRYYAPQPDTEAVGVDAFTHDWTKEVRPYANPPWPVIGRVLKQVAKSKVRIMMVVPQWPKAPWNDLLTKLSEKKVVLTDAVYLDAQGRLRSKPWWNTEVHILDGSRLSTSLQ